MSHSILIAITRPLESTILSNLLIAKKYKVDIASTGPQAVDFIEKKGYKAVILDYELLGINGLEVTRQIKQQRSDTAIILLINKTSTIDSDLHHQGIYEYFRKPFNRDRLMRSLAGAIDYHTLKQKLRVGEIKFRKLIEATSDAILIFEKSGRILLTNKKFARLFSFNQSELSCEKICPKIFDLTSVKPIQKTTHGKDVNLFEIEGIKQDGSSFPAQVRITYMHYNHRAIRAAAIRDLSSQKEVERQNVLFKQRLAEARHLESLGLMAGTVAHDLNNILSGIIGYPELILMDLPKNDKHAEDIKLIRDAGRRAAAVVNDLLMVTKGATEKKEVHNINTFVENYLSSSEFRILEKKHPELTITTDLENKLFNIRCSQVHINKILMNLVANASESTEQPCNITIRTNNQYVDLPIQGYETIAEGEYAVLTIEDNGPGISNEDIHHIFDPFYSKKKLGRSGTGLGLTVVRNTVSRHDGFIDVESGGQGTTFKLYFPITREKEKTTPEQNLRSFYGKGETILVVDDKANQRDIACRILNRLGYQASSVPSGEAAIEYTREHTIDLLMLDMIMDPGINGRETYQRILQNAPHQKAIVVSGYALNEEADQARKLGISQFLAKPYSISSLGKAIKNEICN